jgi:2-amino-4-hydroxy-6-hydroxymethyldihydropteridine diphosphokinase
MRAGIALGSNIGDRMGNLCSAREKIAALSSVREAIAASSIYETEPVGCERGAREFLNAVIEISHAGTAADLLRDLRAIEASLGRLGTHTRNEPRTVDLDLLYHGDEIIDSGELQLPHPRITERRFVLQPLAEVRPELLLPGCNENVSALLARLPDSPAVVRAQSQW